MRLMRAMGPGSVSSLLKTVLDVVYLALMLVGGAVVLAALALLLLHPFAGSLGKDFVLQGTIDIDGRRTDPARLLTMLPALSGLMALVALYVGDLIVIVHRLRQVFATLIRGEPFMPENVGRLRVIGLGLIGLELLGHAVRLAARVLLVPDVKGGGGPPLTPSINLTAWFSILVVFVLAEVFREGARLRRDAELTI